jgi:hypothetical protein
VIYGVVINDLHFGMRDSKRLYDELSLFKQYLKDHPEIQILVFDGDYFDTKLSVTDPATFYAISFFKEVMDIVVPRKVMVRMVQGTRSHELNQLQLFKPYEDGCYFKIIETVQKEDIFGLHILYLPEEYPEDEEAYYKDYKADKYNIIFGHGTWDFVAQMGQEELAARTDIHSAPVFEWSEWKNSVPNGFISFGHIHGRNVYGKKIYYSGSYTRWSYGERSARGFTAFTYDLDKQTYDVQFVDNTIAPRFDTLDLTDLKVDLKTIEIKDLQKLLDEYIEKTDNLRITLTGLSEDKIGLLKKIYWNNPKVKLDIPVNATLLKESSKNKEDFKKYHYITKRELPIDKTIQRFAKEELNKQLDLDVIDTVIEVNNGSGKV